MILFDILSFIDDNQNIRCYRTSAGKRPFFEWFKSLQDSSTQQRIIRRLERAASSHYGDYEGVGEGVYELKLHFGPGYRIYFAEQDNTIVVLLCGGDKSSQIKDIKKARIYWQEFKGEKS